MLPAMRPLRSMKFSFQTSARTGPRAAAAPRSARAREQPLQPVS
jgi:hypothetical protein